MLINKKTLDAIKELNYKQVYEKGIFDERVRCLKDELKWLEDFNDEFIAGNELMPEKIWSKMNIKVAKRYEQIEEQLK